MATPIIKLENVDLWYDKGKASEVHAIKNVSIEINKGEYTAFFGPSGCGKTTILYAISGIDRYQGGKILINGQDITGLSSKELAIFRQTGIGIIFQQFNLVTSLSVLQNVALPMFFIGISSGKADQEAQKLLDRLDIGHLKDRYPFELSGGQQQRVGIARALANNPPIIIADEPLGNLDSSNANNVLEFLKELNEKDGRTIIMVTHEAWSLRDVKKIFYMKDGVITGVEHGASKTMMAEALSKHLNKELTLNNKNGEEPELGDLSARAVSNFLMRGFSIDEIGRFEYFLKQRLDGKIDQKTFREQIDKPFKNGGVGLWKGKAVRISSYVEEVIEKRHDLQAIAKILETRPELPIMDEVRRIRQWLVSEYEGKLSDMQISALDQAISDRLRSFIDTSKFREILDLSKNKYGVGLSFRSSLKFTEKMESILSGGEINYVEG